MTDFGETKRIVVDEGMLAELLGEPAPEPLAPQPKSCAKPQQQQESRRRNPAAPTEDPPSEKGRAPEGPSGCADGLFGDTSCRPGCATTRSRRAGRSMLEAGAG